MMILFTWKTEHVTYLMPFKATTGLRIEPKFFTTTCKPLIILQSNLYHSSCCFLHGWLLLTVQVSALYRGLPNVPQLITLNSASLLSLLQHLSCLLINFYHSLELFHFLSPLVCEFHKGKECASSVPQRSLIYIS